MFSPKTPEPIANQYPASSGSKLLFVQSRVDDERYTRSELGKWDFVDRPPYSSLIPKWWGIRVQNGRWKKTSMIHESFTLWIKQVQVNFFVIIFFLFKNLFKNLKMTMLGNDSLIELGKYVHGLELILYLLNCQAN